METFYTWCAVIGVVLIVGQFLLSLLGFGQDHGIEGHDGSVDLGGAGDVDHDLDHGVDHGADYGADHHDGAWFIGILSARAILAALTVFCLAGLTAIRRGGYDPGLAFSIASASGLGVLLLVGWLLKTFYSFAADGTVHIADALGAGGKVYLPVPAQEAGRGKVTIHVGTRTVEFAAVTTGDALPTGTPVVVTGVRGPKLLEVIRAE